MARSNLLDINSSKRHSAGKEGQYLSSWVSMICVHGVGRFTETPILGVFAREFLNDCSKLRSIASFDEHWTGNILDLYRFFLHFGGILSSRLAHFH
ncbi:hypothetical protein FH972_006388 [Carpinus fangiana]|uniref:Uncharacterized protein n=1 Tax=Carpinus fangiana TaxID=176857 RepID=A0A5N6QU01_9ROSI|nr:hypothetical protein FH972_006388 [Carpinus fangiana]